MLFIECGISRFSAKASQDEMKVKQLFEILPTSQLTSHLLKLVRPIITE